MIIQMFLNVLYQIFDTLTSPIQIPTIPNEVLWQFDIFLEYLEDGAGVLNNYINLPYGFILFSVILSIDAGILLYHLIMWVIRKIPFTGIT